MDARVIERRPRPWPTQRDGRRADRRDAGCGRRRRRPDGSIRPRLRSGWALKRVADDEGRRALRAARPAQHGVLRLDEQDASCSRCSTAAGRSVSCWPRRQSGQAGRARAAGRLIAECGDRGLLDGIAATPTHEASRGCCGALLKPRERTFEWVGDWFVRAYHGLGPLWFSPLAATGLVLLSLAGLVTFSYLVGARYGTPLVVAHRLLLGGLVFIAGRSCSSRSTRPRMAWRWRTTAGAPSAPGCAGDDLPVRVRGHERGVLRAALASHRGQRRRPAVRFLVAARRSRSRARCPRGNVRDVLFQLAFARVRRRVLQRESVPRPRRLPDPQRLAGRAAVTRAGASPAVARLSGMRRDEGSSVLGRYAVAGLVWSLIGAGFVVVLSLRYYDRLSGARAPQPGGGRFRRVPRPAAACRSPFALGMPMLRRARLAPRR